jgi:hypothetical protein
MTAKTPTEETQPTTFTLEPDASRRARLSIAAYAEAMRNPLDYAPLGGRYVVNDVLVDAEGTVIERDE